MLESLLHVPAYDYNPLKVLICLYIKLACFRGNFQFDFCYASLIFEVIDRLSVTWLNLNAQFASFSHVEETVALQTSGVVSTLVLLSASTHNLI